MVSLRRPFLVLGQTCFWVLSIMRSSFPFMFPARLHCLLKSSRVALLMSSGRSLLRRHVTACGVGNRSRRLSIRLFMSVFSHRRVTALLSDEVKVPAEHWMTVWRAIIQAGYLSLRLLRAM